jgi:hypothetical protein
MVAVHVEEAVLTGFAGRVATDARGDGLPAQGVGLAADGGGVGGDGRQHHIVISRPAGVAVIVCINCRQTRLCLIMLRRPALACNELQSHHRIQ